MDEVLCISSASYGMGRGEETYEAFAGISVELCSHCNAGAQIEDGVEGIENCHEERTCDAVHYSSREKVQMCHRCKGGDKD